MTVRTDQRFGDFLVSPGDPQHASAISVDRTEALSRAFEIRRLDCRSSPRERIILKSIQMAGMVLKKLGATL